MKIVFDNIIYALQESGGISVVWSNLICRCLKNNLDIVFLDYENNNISRYHINLPKEKIRKKRLSIPFLQRFIRLSNQELDIDEPFIFHSSYYRTSYHPNAVNITTVHDFVYSFYCKNPFSRYLHCKQQYVAIRKSDLVICISEHTKRDLLKLLPDVDPQKVKVIYNGVDNRFKQIPNCKYKNYFLFVGNRAGYKNFSAIIEPIAKSNFELKIVGPDLTRNEIKAMNNHRLRYTFYGRVTDEELNQLYNEAFCFIYPSLYEGFGLPILEAQMAGCPVIALNTSSLPEVIGNKKMLLNNISFDTLQEKIQLLRDPKTRKQIIEDGLTNAARFSWDKMAEEYIASYYSAIKRVKTTK